MPGRAEGLLRRQRAVTLTGLILLAILAWAWLASGAGMAMGTRFDFSPFPHRAAGMAMSMEWTAARLLLNLSMWWVMMVAMMIPAAAPVVLLYARTAPRAQPAAFLAGYLLIWLGFSILAVGLQAVFESIRSLSMEGMAFVTPWLAGGVLIAAGLYQLTPAKDVCLSHCRNPAEFLSRQFRPGVSGALRMGFLHGTYCVGCCWLLMALLFVGGIMNLAWIAILAIMVAAERMLPHGRSIARIGGLLFLAWGTAILVAG